MFLAGFGVTAPSTGAGKALLVFYGLLGCSASMLFINLFLERLLTYISLFMFWCHTRSDGQTDLEDRTSESNTSGDWKPSVYQITLLLLLVVLVFVCIASSLYSAMEGWTYLESLYFCFVAFSTVGFGDFVSSQKEYHEDIQVYQMSNCLLMLLGVCCTYSLLYAISVIIKKGLNWILSTVNCIALKRLQTRPSFKPCLSDSESQICCSEMDFSKEQMLETAATSDRSPPDCFCVLHGKSFCNEVKVRTVCYTGKVPSAEQEQEQDNYSYENDVRPLPTWLH